MFDKGEIINGRYEITETIGRGGTSCVYLVLDRHIGRMLAMKTIDRSAVGSFYFARSEIEALRRVRYPLIPAISDAFYDDNSIYIVSEYVKGESLAGMCRGRGMSREASLAIAWHICSALVYLHRMRPPMLYLDLKPDNIIIDGEGLPHLIDFGIATCLAGHHIRAGTPGYSPPEQYDRGEELDKRADIFAFGMTYYAIRSGVPPGRDLSETLTNIRHSRCFSAPEKSFLARCCAPSKEERYTDAYEVLKQIRHIRSIPGKIKKSIEITIVAAGILLSGYYITARAVHHISTNRAAQRLFDITAGHIKDGEYTPEGIRIIKAAISSGTLPTECEQYFIFEVAMNEMFAEHDYKAAVQYFSRLDDRLYPEAEDYITLCRMQNGFDYDRQEAEYITGRMLSDVAGRRPSAEKYETLFFIAWCYENFGDDEAAGLAKAMAVTDMARAELKEAGAQEMETAKYERICSRLDELTAVRQERIEAKKKTGRKEYGRSYN